VPAHVRGQGAYAGLLALLVNEPQVSPGGHRGHGSCTLRLPVGAAQPLQCATAAALVFAYVFFVIGLFGGWVHQVYEQHKIVYAFVALTLIVVQGVGLEIITTGLLKLIRTRTE